MEIGKKMCHGTRIKSSQGVVRNCLSEKKLFYVLEKDS